MLVLVEPPHRPAVASVTLPPQWRTASETESGRAAVCWQPSVQAEDVGPGPRPAQWGCMSVPPAT